MYLLDWDFFLPLDFQKNVQSLWSANFSYRFFFFIFFIFLVSSLFSNSPLKTLWFSVGFFYSLNVPKYTTTISEMAHLEHLSLSLQTYYTHCAFSVDCVAFGKIVRTTMLKCVNKWPPIRLVWWTKQIFARLELQIRWKKSNKYL